MAGLVGLAMTAGAAQAADTAADWVRRPTPEDLMAVWPTAAWKSGIGGKAVINCKVSVQGALFDCAVESERPAGAGFGAAAIALTPQLLMKPATRDGQPVVSDVRIPLSFVKPDVPTGTLIPGGEGFYSGRSREVLSNVAWEQAPTYAQVAAAYPKKAREKQLGGRVTLSCAFKAGGKVGACDTLKEEPEGQGLAAAAKSLVGEFRGPSTLPDGRSTVGVITQIPFTFAVEMLDPTKRLIGKPRWAALPKGEDVLAGYPKEAAKAGVRDARVIIVCDVAEGGGLAGCALESEDPGGLGFAASALALAAAFEVRPWTAEGLPTIGGRIRIPIRYALPDKPPVAPAP